MPASVAAIPVATAPSDAACVDRAMSIAQLAYINTGAAGIISQSHAGSRSTIPTRTSVVGINPPIIIPIVCWGGVCVIGWSRRPIVGGGKSGRAIICRTITIIPAVAGTLRLGRARGQKRASDCCGVEQLLHRSSSSCRQDGFKFHRPAPWGKSKTEFTVSGRYPSDLDPAHPLSLSTNSRAPIPSLLPAHRGTCTVRAR